jgi:DNA repair protein RadC
MARRPKPIPMLGEARENPPRVFRAQKVVAQLQKETRPAFREGSTVVGPRELVEITLSDYLGERATEIFLVLFVNVRNQVVGYVEYGSGGVAGVEVNASGILRDALTSGAAAFISVHNHPSGDATPSPEDRQLWNRLRDAGALVGIPVLDNLVVGEGEFFSESEEKAGGLGRTKFSRRA